MQFIVRGLTQDLADEVRRTGLSPGYGQIEKKAPAVSRGGLFDTCAVSAVDSAQRGNKVASVALVAPPRLAAPKSLLLTRITPGADLCQGTAPTA